MTDAMMGLQGLLENTSDADLLREMSNHPAETTAGRVDEAPAIRPRWLPVAVSAASSRAGARRGG